MSVWILIAAQQLSAADSGREIAVLLLLQQPSVCRTFGT
jgi:hypothetical protein